MKIEKTEYGYQVTECDIKFGEQITLDGELLIPISDIEDIKAEIDKLTVYHTTKQGSELICKEAVFRCFNLILNGCRDIIEKHISKKENER